MFSVCISKYHGVSHRIFIDFSRQNWIIHRCVRAKLCSKKRRRSRSKCLSQEGLWYLQAYFSAQLIVLLFHPLFCVLPSQLVLVELDHRLRTLDVRLFRAHQVVLITAQARWSSDHFSKDTPPSSWSRTSALRNHPLPRWSCPAPTPCRSPSPSPCTSFPPSCLSFCPPSQT